MELTAHGCTMGLSASRTTIILLFIFLSNFSFTIATRKDIGFKFTPLCKNIVRDRYLLSDNNGYVCNALSIDSKSRCCPQTGKKFSERIVHRGRWFFYNDVDCTVFVWILNLYAHKILSSTFYSIFV
ncbi:uncharacterized protein LOC131617851 isoform X3 [Vicia villosa]|uniref:uncharacterized protein LOC131617767 isoform X3 n=1 Tax=Vicia villosa TaxID=3911 RepID=UPI00273C5B83|nr:uncharacterized protein LOC131617767 isoform X3 [Vicia villosa]XP_058745110.1 uncharacterized protein LOC131617851 isoform X3 [Vicia villosa]